MSGAHEVNCFCPRIPAFPTGADLQRIAILTIHDVQGPVWLRHCPEWRCRARQGGLPLRPCQAPSQSRGRGKPKKDGLGVKQRRVTSCSGLAQKRRPSASQRKRRRWETGRCRPAACQFRPAPSDTPLAHVRGPQLPSAAPPAIRAASPKEQAKAGVYAVCRELRDSSQAELTSPNSCAGHTRAAVRDGEQASPVVKPGCQ